MAAMPPRMGPEQRGLPGEAAEGTPPTERRNLDEWVAPLLIEVKGNVDKLLERTSAVEKRLDQVTEKLDKVSTQVDRARTAMIVVGSLVGVLWTIAIAMLGIVGWLISTAISASIGAS